MLWKQVLLKYRTEMLSHATLRSYTSEEIFPAPLKRICTRRWKDPFQGAKMETSNYCVVGGRGNGHQIHYRIIHSKKSKEILETCPN